MTTYTTKSNAIRAAKKVLGNDAIPTVDFVVVSQEGTGPRGSKHSAWVWMPKKEAEFWAAKDDALAEDAHRVAELETFTPDDIDTVFGIGPFPAPDAEEPAVEPAPPAMIIDFEGVEPVPEFAQEPAPVKAPKAKKAPKAPKVKAAPVAKAEPKGERGPIGKTALMIAACARPQGATPADLRAISGGTANPWPYVIHNPKGTGWAQRFGYEFENKKVDGKQTYFLKPKK